MPHANSVVSAMSICVHAIRVKTDANDSSKTMGNVAYPGFWTDPQRLYERSLGEISIVPGTYRRVELDLTQDCAEGATSEAIGFSRPPNPVQTSNNAMTVTLIGEQTITSDAAQENFQLNITPIVNALANLSSTPTQAQIQTAVESSTGTF